MDGDSFSFCHVCKINHNQKRKHIFTTKHKNKLKFIMKKYSSKIKIYKGYFENPIIQKEEDKNKQENFWCYFCREEVNLHVTDFQKSILYGGLFEHIGNIKHHEATEIFFRENGIESKFKTQFIVSELDLSNYKKKLVNLVERFEAVSTDIIQKHADKIQEIENSRQLLINVHKQETLPRLTVYKTVKNNHSILQNPKGFHEGVRVWKGGIVKYPSNSDQLIQGKYNKTSKVIPQVRKTLNNTNIDLEVPSLTKVNIKLDPKIGNIFSGAIPPWKMSDNTDKGKKDDVGPSLSLYEAHLKKKEKVKLNPNRVGANFDHSIVNHSEAWLPSFGRVWNDGARWKSRKQFKEEKEISRKRKFSMEKEY